jgi:hypothetical protein
VCVLLLPSFSRFSLILPYLFSYFLILCAFITFRAFTAVSSLFLPFASILFFLATDHHVLDVRLQNSARRPATLAHKGTASLSRKKLG